MARALARRWHPHSIWTVVYQLAWSRLAARGQVAIGAVLWGTHRRAGLRLHRNLASPLAVSRATRSDREIASGNAGSTARPNWRMVSRADPDQPAAFPLDDPCLTQSPHRRVGVPAGRGAGAASWPQSLRDDVSGYLPQHIARPSAGIR